MRYVVVAGLAALAGSAVYEAAGGPVLAAVARAIVRAIT